MHKRSPIFSTALCYRQFPIPPLIFVIFLFIRLEIAEALRYRLADVVVVDDVYMLCIIL